MRMIVREGARFDEILHSIEATQWYGEEALRSYQEKALQALIGHVAEHVPYYQSLFRKLGISPKDISRIEDLPILPYMSKATVLQNSAQMVSKKTTAWRIKISTSGSTGTPLVLFQDLTAVIREHAFIWRQLKWTGYARGKRRAWIRGDLVVPAIQKSPPFWRLNRSENMLMMSSYHLSETNAAGYLAALEEFNPTLIQAYPSSIGFIARYLESRGRTYRGIGLHAIVTSSETLGDTEHRTIEARFGCRVFDHYGAAERVSLIQTCEHGRRHIASDYSLTELTPIADDTYEIVGTSFNNLVFPLIRYRTGDSVVIDRSSMPCPCGRKFAIVSKILGRTDDYLKTVDGRRIGRLDHIFKGVRNIAEAQIVQDRLDEVIIRVVPLTEFSQEQRSQLIRNTHERLGQSTRIRIETVEAIPRTRNGKIRAVVCNVP
jgi:phenylacetate-CoA ligase